ncbi:Light-induced protein, chloroplastic [Porphyridium purpureum]|uniref:Light-induced protein, chloroplastic n=1 Tax=Porphyridium purpureum TaxID=35688 RepID=A0A5J4Z0A7_PORPP|nr:Light-induced protein, chloroplastic [Porphyridium purpureum]|eukprot:POR9568..scf208_2
MAFVNAAGAGGVSVSVSVSARGVCHVVERQRCARVRHARCAPLRMQDDDAMPSDTFSFSDAAEQSNKSDGRTRKDAMERILRVAASTNRGRLASATQIAEVEDLVLMLESVNPNLHPMETSIINGNWKLVFFAKTAGSKMALEPLIKAQNLIEFGDITQKIDLSSASLVQDAEIFAFPGITGTITTSARITPVGPERMEITLGDTKVKGNSLLNRIDLSSIDKMLPVDAIYQRLRGKPAETYIDTYYLDEALRISRDKRGNLYIFVKE